MAGPLSGSAPNPIQETWSTWVDQVLGRSKPPSSYSGALTQNDPYGGTDPSRAPFPYATSTPPVQAAAAEAEPEDPETTADIRLKNAQAAKLEREAAAEDDPNKQALLLKQIEQINLEIEQAKSRLSPEAQARLENQLAMERQAAQNTFTAGQAQAGREFEAGENRATREANMVTNLLNQAARRDEFNQSSAITVRGQEIDRLKAQDDWVLGMLRQQVAEGTLGLQKATSQFNAYVDRARLPTQILESVAKSVEPLLPYMTARKEGESPPGFEKGGPMEGLVNRAGGSYDPKQYAVRPVKMDLFKLAEKAGANFKESGKVPDPGSHFSGVQTSFANPSQQSAVQPGALPPVPGPLPSLASGPSPIAAAEQGQQAAMPFNLSPTSPGLSMTEDERSRIAQMLQGAV